MVVWDSVYSSSPGSSLSKTLIDDEIRRLKFVIRERMEVEHFWEDDIGGKHIPGGTTVMSKGDSTAMAAVSNPAVGSLYLLEDGSDLQIHYYNGGWNKLSTLDHLGLAGILDDDHSGLLLKDGILVGNLNMGGYKIGTNGVGSTFGHFLLYGHKSGTHTTVGNVAAIKDDSIGQGELKISQVETTQIVANGGVLHINALPGFNFVPQVYVKAAYNSNIYFRPSNTAEWGFEVVNSSGASVEIRVRQEAIIS